MTAIKGGYTNYGQDIGILMMRTVFPRLVGDIGNARTFSMPVRYQIVDVDPLNMTAKNADSRLLTPFIEAARQLEAEGCKAIATSCGFLAEHRDFNRVRPGHERALFQPGRLVLQRYPGPCKRPVLRLRLFPAHHRR